MKNSQDSIKKNKQFLKLGRLKQSFAKEYTVGKKAHGNMLNVISY